MQPWQPSLCWSLQWWGTTCCSQAMHLKCSSCMVSTADACQRLLIAGVLVGAVQHAVHARQGGHACPNGSLHFKLQPTQLSLVPHHWIKAADVELQSLPKGLFCLSSAQCCDIAAAVALSSDDSGTEDPA